MKTILTLVLTLAIGAAMAQDCCAGGKGKNAWNTQPMNAQDAQYLAQAEEMLKKSDKKDGCGNMGSCPDKKMAKAKPMGDCHDMKMAKKEAGMKAAFKVFVAGKGYEKFCCEDMAVKARMDHIARGEKVGKVQKVASK